MSVRGLTTSKAGVKHFMLTEGNNTRFVQSQDTTPILEQNMAMVNHNDGYSPTRELRRVASIPFVIIAKWLNEEGWNALDPDNADKLAQKLNDPDYAYLRTASGRVGVSNGVMR
jgi:hypothetical protein